MRNAQGIGTGMKITHIITGLAADGAENALYHLLAAMDRREYQNDVISLTDRGPTAAKIEALDVPVRALGMMRGVPNPLAIRRIAKILRRSRPQVVHTWMYHSNLLGGLAAQAAGRIPVIWGIHHSRVDTQDTKRSTVWTVRACAWFSKQLPARIICCANSSELAHVQLGYDSKKMEVIYNGIDTELFRPNPEARLALRSRLGLPPDALLIGMAGRLHRHKDHRTFFAAARLLRKEFSDVHFVLCGEGLVADNAKLAPEIAEGLAGHCHLMGEQREMPAFYGGLDIAANSSLTEAFPLAVGEAMACGVPCVVTDVGDSPAMVGETGRIVPPRQPALMAHAWGELISAGAEARRMLGDAARERVVTRFSVTQFAQQYQSLYRNVASRACGDHKISLAKPEASVPNQTS
jgi:glycosyltransferase involved in cell wall biosynthesis